MRTSLKAKLAKLRPTQMALGYAEVAHKRKQWRALGAKEAREFLISHRFPAIRGPKGRLYITDHHHLGRAAAEAGIDTGFFLVEEDFSKLAIADFWPKMQQAQWVHPIDETGRLRTFQDIPQHLEQLIDDPYRSLAGYVRNAGGYEKTAAAFAEFLWADFFRPRVPVGDTRPEFHASVDTAVKLAVSPDAAHLPGYKGPQTEPAKVS